MPQKNICKDILFGLAVGDALGVPVEFQSRESLKRKPVTGMESYGTHNQPAGTFSDDSSLAFCLAEALTKDFNLQEVANNFIAWLYDNFWTAHGYVFDFGGATERAIRRLHSGIQPDLAGGTKESDNGNGSLMRILPLIVCTGDKSIEERYRVTKQVSSITHGHIHSVLACFYYLEFARYLTLGKDKFDIHKSLQTEVSDFLRSLAVNPSEIDLFHCLLNNNIYELKDEKIFTDGYVLHTLEASIWCLLTTSNYKDAVLRAVNLGEDTDTTGAVTGGLAGLLYGFENIPGKWIDQLAGKEDIEDLAGRVNKFYFDETTPFQ